jgi:hypothetical protein
VPDPVTEVFARLLKTEPPGEVAGRIVSQAERVERLEASLADLEKKVRSQARTITNLRKRVGGEK